MAVKLTEEESQQLLRTVEMFEAIAESQPDDYQSLEILKEAYAKLGRKAESLDVSKRLGRAYIKVGQISQAVLEFEALAQEFPQDVEVKSALQELEAKTAPTDSSAPSAPSLAEDSKPTPPIAGGPAGAPRRNVVAASPENGDLALSNALIAEKLVTPQAVEPLLAQLRELRANPGDFSHPLSLTPLLANEQIVKADDILAMMVEKTKLPYLPLSIYDVDRDIAQRLPQDICFQHCLVPFDLMSRSILITTSNPFDQAARQQVEAMLDYHVFWYISPPGDIVTTLRRAYGLDNQKTNSSAAAS